MKRIGSLGVWLLLALLVSPGRECSAQDGFPSKMLNLLVGFPPGGMSDTIARSMAPVASKQLGQPIVVLNKPGAAGTLAVDALLASKPDGYTILSASSATLTTSMFTQGVSWGPKDFSMILGHSLLNLAVVVRSDAPWKTFEEWVQYVRQNPGFKYGTYGPMGLMHVMMEWIAKRLDLKMTPVHFPGDAPALTNLLGGHIQAHGTTGAHAALVRAGKLKTLVQVVGEPVDPNPQAVSRLIKALPDAPIEIADPPYGIFGPKGIPDAVVAKLHAAFKKATTENPEFIRANQTMNMQVVFVEPKELAKKLLRSHEVFGGVVKKMGLERK